MTWPAVDLSPSTWITMGGAVNPVAVRIFWASSGVLPFTSGTVFVLGPFPTTIVITLVMADVELAGGNVASTWPFRSGVEGDIDSVVFSKPAALSFAAA